MISRREFLRFSALGLLSAPFFGCAQFPLLGGQNSKKGKLVFPSFNSNYVRIYDLEKDLIQTVKLSFGATHSAIKHPFKEEILVFDNMGPGCSKVDITKAEVVKEAGKSDRFFYGHGVYAPDGKHFLCTEFVPDSESYLSGTLAIRDSTTLEKVGEWNTHGVNPHDLCFVNSDTIAITNHGNYDANKISNVTFLNYRSGTLIKKVEKGDSGHFGHLIRYSDQEVFVAGVKGAIPDTAESRKWKKVKERTKSVEADWKLRNLMAYDPNPFYRVGVNGLLEALPREQNKEFFRNNFSLARSPKDSSLFATASGAGDSVIVWKRGGVFKVFVFPGMYPSAVAFSADGSMLVAGSANGKIRFIDTKVWGEVSTLKWDHGPVHILSLG